MGESHGGAVAIRISRAKVVEAKDRVAQMSQFFSEQDQTLIGTHNFLGNRRTKNNSLVAWWAMGWLINGKDAVTLGA